MCEIKCKILMFSKRLVFDRIICKMFNLFVNLGGIIDIMVYKL